MMSSPANRKEHSMQARLPWDTLAPKPLQLMLGMEGYFKDCSLERSLIELVKMRASQINGCGYCLDMHSKDARALGETEQRLYALSAWQDSPFFSAREQAALAWAEAVTNIADGHVSGDLYDNVRRQFGEKELTDLTWIVATINSWNRISISFRVPVGNYQPAEQ